MCVGSSLYVWCVFMREAPTATSIYDSGIHVKKIK